MKRFTETEKWKDPWFRNLPPMSKLAWGYICDNCDNAGVWDPDFALADFQIGGNVDWEHIIKDFGDRVKILSSGKWHIVGFISFQQKELSLIKASHKQIVVLCQKHGIDIPSISHESGIATLTGNSHSKGKGNSHSKGKGGNNIPDDEWLEKLKDLYPGVDTGSELLKMKAWLMTPRGHGRKFSRQFIVNWLNRCDRPVNGNIQSESVQEINAKKEYTL
jgi:hypothetical protein